MTISKLAMAAKKRIEAEWLHGEAYDLATQAAEGLESAQMLQSPETAAELERLRARVAELEAAQKPSETYPPVLPWAALMDDEDLAEFLAELEHAIGTPGATPTEALAAVEKACGTWRVIGEAQHAHNTAPGPDVEPDALTQTFAPVAALREDDPFHLHHAYRLGRDLPEPGGPS